MNPKTTATFTTISTDKNLMQNVSQIFKTHTNSIFTLFTLYFSFSKLTQILVWIHRIDSNAHSLGKIKDWIKVTKLDKACKTIIKLVQPSVFSSEIRMIKKIT